MNYDVLFHTDLSRKNGSSNGLDLDRLNWGNYDLVVIDESHNFRNGNGTHANTQKCLSTWHNKMTQKLGIEIKKSRRKRDGIGGAVYYVPGLINNDLNFCPIEKQVVRMIKEQSSGYKLSNHYNTSELYSEDVQLFTRNGKIYYLPKESKE